jgi:MFS family permease
MAIPMIMPAVLTPAFGYLTDKIGRRPLLNLLSALVMAGSFILFITLPNCRPTIF